MYLILNFRNINVYQKLRWKNIQQQSSVDGNIMGALNLNSFQYVYNENMQPL